MDEYVRTIKLNEKEKDYIKTLLSMIGKQIYDKYGLKRDETIVHTAKFADDIEIDIKLVICEGEDKPYTEAVAFRNGSEIACTDVEDEYVRKWTLDIDNHTYVVIVD